MPYDIREHVDLIKPTVHFRHHVPNDPASLRKHSNPILGNKRSLNGSYVCKLPDLTSLERCDEFIHPKCLQTLYSMQYTPKRPKNNSYGIGALSFVELAQYAYLFLTPLVEFMPQAYVPQDLDRFFRFAPLVPNFHGLVVNIHFSMFYGHQKTHPVLVSIDGGGCSSTTSGPYSEPIIQGRL